ncbi:conserved hypothetical protein [Roseibium sp. TrichSKD4]|uniref:zinc metallochaperone AztD n=1 Tax=Roseibium sp. TrichSKD4 TaxID=744980 RepID=UPI0001E571A5|nr:zinc metallochaperone AztD [Roseibium sp. TrichSKD4]EFO28747.1 conserved hypothetical protein [Roseibium sp. TrichSKD4]
MRKSLLASAALSLAFTALAMPAMAEEVTEWRLFVSDHSDPKVTVVDALEGATIETIQIKAPASLYRSKGGEAVFAVQRNGNIVNTISSGIAFEDHGDHGDIKVAPPKITGAEIAGEYPVHFVEHDGQLAVFFDKEGVARVFSERDALKGSVDLRAVEADAPHHWVAVAFGDHDLVSVPHPEDPSKLPVGIGTLDREGNEVGATAACPDLHGEAASGNLLVFACATGLLVVTEGDGGPQIRHVAYPQALPDGKSTTVVGGIGIQYFLGNYGADKVVIIDPTGDGDFRLVDLPMRRVHFAVDPVRPKFAYVFTEDGQLHQLDILTGAISATLSVTEAYSMDGHWSDPRPRVAVAGGSIVVTDPLAGKLHLIGAVDFKKVGEIAVGGQPYNIVAVGGTGMSHGDTAGHKHDH